MRFLRRFAPYSKYVKQQRGAIIAAVVYGAIFGVSSSIGVPFLIKYVFPPIFEHGSNAMAWQTVLQIAACIPLLFLLRGYAGYLNSYYTQYAGVHILEALRLDYFRKLQVLPLSFVHGKATGDLISRGLADTAQLQFTITLLANDGIKQPAMLVGALGTLVFFALTGKGVWIVLICLAIVPVSVVPIRYVGRKVIKRAQQLQAQLGDVTGHFSENLAAAREVRAFSLEQHEVKRFGLSTHALAISQTKIAKYAQALSPAIEVLSAIGISVTLVFAYGSGVDLETFLAVITTLYFSYEPIKKIGSLNSDMKRGLAALERLEAVFDEPVTITDPAEPVSIGRLKGEIAFENLSFSYKNNVPALSRVNVRVPAGTVCALVGPSGAGKSTFANLVPRFYDPKEGSLTIDGIDVRAMRLADLRRNIAIVSQDPVLFNDTIYANLLLGRPEATREEVERAAADAFAHDFITQMPQGYETIVGERGSQLSGGQKQRIAIARAFLRNAPILILDEATSALDSESEAAIQEALRKLVVGKTVLIIAHRFSTIRDASMILVFERGEIVAKGPHGEVYANSALYKSLFDRQQL
ncbi:MAG TPA: ABC transporter ATP-binding protein [Opitutaceae bacterium]|nr:ABC transporter ATP-binding protein [Opitutaceae bacterium]